MSEKDFTGCENHSLRRLRVALIRGLLNDAECLEVFPHRMTGIGEPTVRIGFPGEQVAEFIVHHRLRDGQNRQQGGAQGERE